MRAEFKEDQMVKVVIDANGYKHEWFTVYHDGIVPGSSNVHSIEIPNEKEARKLVPQVYEELDRLREENSRLKGTLRFPKPDYSESY